MAPSSVSCPLGVEKTCLAPLTRSTRALKCRTVWRERRRRWSRARAENIEAVEDPLEVEDIDREYCNDFICTSSPSVEETIKAFAVDLQRPGRWTLSRFPQDVIYKALLKKPLNRGRQGYERLNWISESVQRPRVVSFKLHGGVKGSVLNQPISVAFQSVIRLNLLSGRIMEHKDDWDLKECSLLGAVAFNVSRSFWSIQQLQQDTSEGLQKIGDKLGSDDEEASPYIVDPRDPYTVSESPPGL